MTSYRDKIDQQKRGGLYKVADFAAGKEVTHVISHLAENVQMFEKEFDVLNFQDTGRQLQMNVTNAEALMTLYGDDPRDWADHQITLYLDEYKPGKFGIRVRAPGAKTNGPKPPAIAKPVDMNDETSF